MSEILLQTIVEKLEALSVAILKKDTTGGDEKLYNDFVKEIKTFQPEIKMFRDSLKLNNDKISSLNQSLNNYRFQLGQPVKNNVEHRHVLHKGIWVAAILFNIALFLTIALNNSLQSKKQYKANDIKYRYLKLTGDKSSLKILFHADSLYNINAEAIIKRTLQEEQRLAKQAEMLRLADEREKELKELKRKAGKK